MLKFMLALTIFGVSQISSANVGQKGCTIAMYKEAEAIRAHAVSGYNNGVLPKGEVDVASLNVIEVGACAKVIEPSLACAEMKRMSQDLVEDTKKGIDIGMNRYSEYISAVNQKNEIEIFCSK